ncbi:MAG: LamG-like jellyroll fold domain-containing protein [Candidatus Paceibacterota bacterium]
MILNSSKFNSLNKLNYTFRGNFAFTLIELLVVIAIIGILSALIIIGMNSTTQKATIAKAQVFSNSLRNSLMGNLVSEWKFDQVNFPAAGQTPDSWSGGNAGTLYGSGGLQSFPQLQSAASCVSGGCFSFDGTDDFVDCADGDNLDITDAITISAWAYKEGVYVDANTIVGKLETAYWVYVYSSHNIKVWTNIGGASIPRTTSANTFSDNQWHYVVFSYNENGGSNNFNIYIDGVNKYATTLAGKISTNNSDFHIGSSGGSGSYFFTGRIDDVRIFNAAMPTSQIQQMYFVGINKLLAKNQITENEYNNRIADLTNNYAKE